MKKYILLFLVFMLVMCNNIKAVNITKEDLGYSYTFISEVGRNFSDKAYIYYVDGKVSYCIEPGVPLGSNESYSVGNITNITSSKRDRIEKLMYYGYLFNNHTDKKYYMATQALIWNELLTNKDGVVYSTKLFKEGDILDLSSYINEIERTISIYTVGPYKFKMHTVYLGDEMIIPITNNILNDFKINSISSVFNYKLINNDLYLYNFKKAGSYNINTTEKDKYDSNYIVYTNSDKQDLLSIGNISHIPIYQILTIKSCSIKINKKDKESDELIGPAKYGLYDLNDKLVNEIVINEEGIGSITKNLSIGNYYIKEITAPDEYELDNNKYDVVLSSNNPDVELTLYDEKIKEEPVVELINEINDSKPVKLLSNNVTNVTDDEDILFISNVPNTNKNNHLIFIVLLSGVIIVIKEVL